MDELFRSECFGLSGGEVMIEVTWGNNHPPYDKSDKDYNNPYTKWNRYSENMKR